MSNGSKKRLKKQKSRQEKLRLHKHHKDLKKGLGMTQADVSRGKYHLYLLFGIIILGAGIVLINLK